MADCAVAQSAFSLTLLSPGPAVSPLSAHTLLHYNPPGGGQRREMSKRCKFEAGKGKRKRFRSFFFFFLNAPAKSMEQEMLGDSGHVDEKKKSELVF